MADETVQGVQAPTPEADQAPEAAPAPSEFSEAFKERVTEQKDGVKPSEEPAPNGAGPSAAPSEEATTAAPAAPASKPDPWDGLTPEQKSYFNKLQASERSQRGRVGALTKKLNSFERTAPPAQPDPAPTSDDQTGRPPVAPAPSGATATDLDARLQAAMNDYGDVIGPVVDLLKDTREKIAKLETQAAPADGLSPEDEIAALTALADVHPDYAEVARDANFQNWLGDQPVQVIELANSYDPRDVSLALTLFKTERSAAMASQSGQDAQGKQDGTATDARRARQLASSTDVPSRGAPAAAGVPNDFSTAFKARVEQQKREAAR